MFKCKKCTSSFNRKDSLLRHTKTHDNVRFECNICSSKNFSRKDALTRHIKLMHQNEEKIHPNQVELILSINITNEEYAGPSNSNVVQSNEIWGDNFDNKLFLNVDEQGKIFFLINLYISTIE